MSTFQITVDSAFAGGRDHLDTTIRTPLDPQMAYELGTAYPSAQDLADWYAGEYCDSGTVRVVGAGQRGLVARRSVA